MRRRPTHTDVHRERETGMRREATTKTLHAGPRNRRTTHKFRGALTHSHESGTKNTATGTEQSGERAAGGTPAVAVGRRGVERAAAFVDNTDRPDTPLCHGSCLSDDSAASRSQRLPTRCVVKCARALGKSASTQRADGVACSRPSASSRRHSRVCESETKTGGHKKKKYPQHGSESQDTKERNSEHTTWK